jgi:hypothetical protein
MQDVVGDVKRGIGGAQNRPGLGALHFASARRRTCAKRAAHNATASLRAQRGRVRALRLLNQEPRLFHRGICAWVLTRRRTFRTQL